MAARFRIRGYQGLKHCLAFLLLSLLLLTSSFLGWVLYRSWNQGCSQCQSSGSQFLHQSFTHSSTEQRWLCQRYSSEHYGCRPHLWAAYLLLLFFLPKEEDLEHKVVMEKDPGRETGSPRCVLFGRWGWLSFPQFKAIAPPDPVNHGPGMGYNNWQLLFES